jgi:hypothetical protein
VLYKHKKIIQKKLIYIFFYLLAYAHTSFMNLEQLDDKLVNFPLSREERLEYIKVFLNKRYLDGIDKGTILENARIKKIEKIKIKKFDKFFLQFKEYVEEKILRAEKRVYREKYRGLYNYYEPKKTKRKKLKKKPVEKPPVKLKQKNIWG